MASANMKTGKRDADAPAGDAKAGKSKGSVSSKKLILVGLNGLLVLTFGLLIVMFASGGDESGRALKKAQRLKINIKTGEIVGAPGVAKFSNAEEKPLSAEEREAARAKELADSFAASAEEEAEAQEETAQVSAEEAARAAEEEALQAIPAYPRTVASLTEAPHPELIEETEWGGIPKTATIGSPKGYYARQSTAKPGQAQIAIIVVDVGGNKELTDKILAMPPDITISFNPYAPFTPQWVESARHLGHEAWIDVPMQPRDFPASDPGPLAVLKDIEPAQNLPRLHELMAKFPGYVGMVMPLNEGFSESRAHAEWFVKEVTDRGVALLMPDGNAGVAIKKAMQTQNDAIIESSAVLDAEPNQDAIAQKLAQLELEAKSKGKALAIMRPYPISMGLVAGWASGLAAKNIALVPASAMLHH